MCASNRLPGHMAAATVLAATVWLAGCVTVHEDGGFEWWWDAREPLEGETATDRMRNLFARHDPDAARMFWGMALARLHGEDVGRLADMEGTVRLVSDKYAWLPGMREYADWLKGRQAYFEAARHATAVEERRFRMEREAARLAPATGKVTVRTVPAALSVPTAFSRTPLPPSLPKGRPKGVRREHVETGRAYWRGKVETQPRPVGADHWAAVAVRAFRGEAVPDELAWMAEVESSWNPSARSPVGAAGLFQLMPRTATSLGLALSPEDERLDPAASSRAAARYLKTLHGRFGSWPLALAAYNAGQGRVSTLCRKHGKSFDAIAAHLPVETRLYVPRVLETVRVRTGVDPETLPAPG